MLFGGFQRVESAQILTLFGFGIDLTGIDPVLSDNRVGAISRIGIKLDQYLENLSGESLHTRNSGK